MLFTCPICKGALEKKEKACVCPNGHSYDRAAEGYVHLLPPNKMHSKVPGDTKQMVRSRRDFLEGGFYGLFSDALNGLVLESTAALDSPILVDAGCGEGYYTRRLKAFLEEHGKQPRVSGFDISKCAVKAAAKRSPGIEFAVASIFDIPAAEEAADCVINVFAPIVERELARILRPGGTLLVAVPGERHLFGLKEILYDDPYENEHRETEYDGFRFVKRVPVRGDIHLSDPKTIQDLFAMTPYYWKTPVQGSLRLQEKEELFTEIAFDFIVYEKNNR